MRWLRAFAAGSLSVLLPGAGHVLLRDWFRALVFAGLYVTAVALFFPELQDIAAAGSVTDTAAEVSEEIDTPGQFILSFIHLFAAIDATFRGLGFPPNDGDSTDGPTCPECGKAIDEDLEFCHWCTTRLETHESEESEEVST